MTHTPPRGPLLSLGLRYMLASALCFSIMSMLVKLVGRRLPSQEIVLARCVVSLALSWITIRHLGISPWGTQRGLLVLRGLLGFVALSCFYYAVTKLPLADATVIQYTNPLFTAFFAAALLGERLSARVLAATATAIVGIVLIAQPSWLFGAGEVRLETTAVAAAMLGAVVSAGAYTTVRKLGSSEAPIVVVFYFPLVATPLALPTALPVALWPTPLEWLLMLGVGVSTHIAQVFMTRGLQLERAGRATAVTTMQVVFAFGWGLLVFDEVPTPISLLGSVVILLSILVVARSKAR